MKASDTVMSEDECVKVYQRAEYRVVDGEYNRQRQAKVALAEAQAEISFKAGQEEEKKHWTAEIEKQVHEAHEAGIQEGIRKSEVYLGIEGEGKLDILKGE